MFDRKPDTARRVLPLAVSMCALTLAVPALAQDGEARAKRPQVSRAKPVAPNSTTSLVNLLIKQGVITEGSFGPDGVFVADSVLAKHDERYMPKEVADGLKAKGVWQESKSE